MPLLTLIPRATDIQAMSQTHENLELEHPWRNYLQKCNSILLFVTLPSLTLKTLKPQDMYMPIL